MTDFPAFLSPPALSSLGGISPAKRAHALSTVATLALGLALSACSGDEVRGEDTALTENEGGAGPVGTEPAIPSGTMPAGSDTGMPATATAPPPATGTGPLLSPTTLPTATGTGEGMGGAGPIATMPTGSADAGAAGEGTGGSGGATNTSGGSGGGPIGMAGAGGTPSGELEMEWLPSWGTTNQRTEDRNLPPPLGDKTLRQYIWPTFSGEEVRIELSNVRGTSPAVLTKVHIALAGPGTGQIDTATDAEFTFGGSAAVTIAAGETVWSDPLAFPLRELGLTAVTIHFTSVPTEITGHPGARTTSYIGSGDTVSAASLTNPETRERWYFINTLEVMAPADAFAVCALGDSITDGYGVLDTFERWTDFFTLALKADPMTADKVSVINAGMGANSLLNSNTEQDAGRVRFERDCVGRPKVKWAIVLEAVNDIGSQSDTALVGQVIGAYQEMIDKGHEVGMLVYGSPITPFGGNADYAGGQALQLRNEINDWVVTSGAFDAVIRFDEAVADPGNPDNLLETYSNDGLHPSIAGYEAMGHAVDTSLFYE